VVGAMLEPERDFQKGQTLLISVSQLSSQIVLPLFSYKLLTLMDKSNETFHQQIA
jgi:hypothetical protein